MNQKPNQNMQGRTGEQTPSFPQKEATWATQSPIMDGVSRSLAEIASSIRILEDRYLNLRRKSQLTDQAIIELQKDYYKEKKHLNQELLESKIQLQELTDELKIMQGELKDTVKQKDLKVINTYLDFWEPLQFVTRKEIEKLIRKE